MILGAVCFGCNIFSSVCLRSLFVYWRRNKLETCYSSHKLVILLKKDKFWFLFMLRTAASEIHRKNPTSGRHRSSGRVGIFAPIKRKNKISVKCQVLGVMCHVSRDMFHLSPLNHLWAKWNFWDQCHFITFPREESFCNWFIWLSTFVNGSNKTFKKVKCVITYPAIVMSIGT